MEKIGLEEPAQDLQCFHCGNKVTDRSTAAGEHETREGVKRRSRRTLRSTRLTVGYSPSV